MVRTEFAAAVLLCAASISALAEDAPGWFRDAARASVPAYGPKVPAVVLLNDRSIAVDETGKTVTTTRMALRTLTREGARYASGGEVYMTDGGKVREFRAWLMYPSGTIKKFEKNEILDRTIADNDIYNEYRLRVVSGASEADPGAVFGYEAVVEEKSVFTQFDFEFQDTLPVVRAQLSLTLPAGWSADSLTVNHPAKIEPKVNGSSYTWELGNLPHIELEDSCPNGRALSPRVSGSYFSSSTKKPFATWEDVSQWLNALNESQYEPDEAVRAKALELTRDAKSDFEKIQALGRFAQAVNYVSIQTGIGRGGGYKPHAAAQTFAKRYGDCKDKANLLRSMLKAVGITAYPVAIYSGDRNYVDALWPSPQAFNHAISAIAVPDSLNAPAVATHPKLGRLLFFDPTDPYIPVGSLPGHEQGSNALVIDASRGGLMKAPAPAPDPRLWVRKVDATLRADGGVEGVVTEKRQGDASGRLRRRYKGLSADDYRKSVERSITSGVPGAAYSDLKTSDAHDEIEWSAKFASPRFAQIPQPQLMIFRAGVLRMVDLPRFPEKSRKLPVVMDPEALTEFASVRIPEGFVVDELPDSLKLDSPYGKVEATWKQEGNQVTFTRTLALHSLTVPAAEYPALKKFLDAANGAGEMPVVLMKR